MTILTSIPHLDALTRTISLHFEDFRMKHAMYYYVNIIYKGLVRWISMVSTCQCHRMFHSSKADSSVLIHVKT